MQNFHNKKLDAELEIQQKIKCKVFYNNKLDAEDLISQ